MAKMSGFVWQDEYFDRTAKLSDQELGRLVRALNQYHMTGEAQELAGRESIAFDFIRIDIDRIEDSYNKKCQKLSDNLKREPNGNQMDPKREPNGKKKSPKGLQDKDKVKDKDKYNIFSSYEEKNISASRFIPPTVDEVAEYCEERQNNIDAQEFCDFYMSKGWMVGHSKMKDWRAAVRTWEQRNRPVASVYEMPL